VEKRAEDRIADLVKKAMQNKISASAVRRIFFRAPAGLVAFLNNSLELRLGSVVPPRDAAMPVGGLRDGHGTSLEQTGRHVWHSLWKRQRTAANERFH